MKRILALLLCGLLLCGLVACGEAPASTDSDAPSTGSDSAAPDKEDSGVVLFDPDAEHKFLACDVLNHSIVVYDLNPCDGDFEKLTDDDLCVVWEWDSDEDPACKIKPDVWIDAAKIRYSAYYDRDVMIACASNGWAGFFSPK